jgi:hypothetical protein
MTGTLTTSGAAARARSEHGPDPLAGHDTGTVRFDTREYS